jgi:hypothetical protein
MNPFPSAHQRCTSALRSTLPLLTVLIAATACRGGETPPPQQGDTTAPRQSTVPELPVDRPSLAPRVGARATRVAVRRDTTSFSIGPAVVTLASGDTLVVSDSAVRAWRLGDGQWVAVSGLDGAGGYENEGQSLTLIDVEAGTRRRVVSDYFAIIGVTLVEDAGRRALLVRMRDGGTGSLHMTVVDPDRGQVFRATNARAEAISGAIVVRSYGDGETPVTANDARTPLRIDTIPLMAVDSLGLLVLPRARQ